MINRLSVLMGLCGVFWTAAYFLIIRRGFMDATHGMPVVALCANLAWEFIFSFVYPPRRQQLLINYTWLVFDLVILYQYLRFGLHLSIYKDNPLLFYASFVVLLAACYAAIVWITKKTSDTSHGKYAAFGQNLLMSMLFVYVLCSERSIDGQSMYIAMTKMIGSAFSSVAFYKYFPRNAVLNSFFVLTFIFDLLYAALLHQALSNAGINPWERL